jgi:hypothetical protein
MRDHPLVPAIRLWLLVAGMLLLSAAWPELALGLLPMFLLPNCTCCNSCTIFSDDYSTDRTGTDYTTVAGSFSVGSGVLTCTTSNSVIIEQTAMSGGATGVHSTCTMKFGNTADVGRLIIGYVDSNTYWFAQLQAGATDGTLKIFQRSGGVNTQQGSTNGVTGLAINTNVSVCISAAGGYVSAYTTVGSHQGLKVSGTPTTASSKAGVATGNVTTSVTFDDLVLNKNVIDDITCSNCTGCPNQCSTEANSVSLTFSGVTAGSNVPSGCPTSAATNYNATFICPRGTGTCTGVGEFTSICDSSLKDDFFWSFAGTVTLGIYAEVFLMGSGGIYRETWIFGAGADLFAGPVTLPANCAAAGTAHPTYSSGPASPRYTNWSGATCTAVAS